jgi:hypothetical protein
MIALRRPTLRRITDGTTLNARALLPPPRLPFLAHDRDEVARATVAEIPSFVSDEDLDEPPTTAFESGIQIVKLDDADDDEDDKGTLVSLLAQPPVSERRPKSAASLASLVDAFEARPASTPPARETADVDEVESLVSVELTPVIEARRDEPGRKEAPRARLDLSLLHDMSMRGRVAFVLGSALLASLVTLLVR